jgi:hypothetical protein
MQLAERPDSPTGKIGARNKKPAELQLIVRYGLLKPMATIIELI